MMLCMHAATAAAGNSSDIIIVKKMNAYYNACRGCSHSIYEIQIKLARQCYVASTNVILKFNYVPFTELTISEGLP